MCVYWENGCPLSRSPGAACQHHSWITRLFQLHFSHSSKTAIQPKTHTALGCTQPSLCMIPQHVDERISFKGQSTQRYDLEHCHTSIRQSSLFSRSLQHPSSCLRAVFAYSSESLSHSDLILLIWYSNQTNVLRHSPHSSAEMRHNLFQTFHQVFAC